MKEAAIGFGIGILLILALYFFWHKPELKKEYERGLAACLSGIDTVLVPGKDSIIYRDTSFHSTQPVTVYPSDSLITLKSKFDSTFVSGKDTIDIKSSVGIELKRDSTLWKETLAEWVTRIIHKDFTEAPDTIKIYVMEEKEVPAIMSWYRTDTFAYIISAIIYVGTLVTILFN